MIRPSVSAPIAPPVEWDPAQMAVLELAADACAVVAGGPGTGKTAVLVERVVRLAAAGISPDQLIVLTPTRQTATDLRDRLALAVGAATTGPLARSVASFAFQLVRAAEVHAGGEPPQLLTGAEEDQIIGDLLDGDAQDESAGRRRWPSWLPASVRATRGFRGEVRAFLAECATLGIDPDRLARLADDAGVDAWRALAQFQRDYLRVRADMRGAHRDAAGLVREAVGVLRGAPSVSGPLQAFARLRAVLVDDAQELTLGGVELLEACRRRGMAVIAFGDPDIGSGAFRGATPGNFSRLVRSLGGRVLALNKGHRATAAQQDLVHAVTTRIGVGGVVAHRRAPEGVEPDASVRSFLLRSAAEELDVIARLLRERHVHDGVPWQQCAVIAHDTRQVALIEAELAARDVPTQAGGQGAPLGSSTPVRDLLHLIDLASTPTQDWDGAEVERALTGIAGGLDPVSLRRLRMSLRIADIRESSQGDVDAAPVSRSGRELLVGAVAHPLEFDAVDSVEARAARRLALTVAQLRDGLDRGDSAHELLWLAWDRSGRQREWAQAARGGGMLAEQANRDLDGVVALFQSAKRFGERAPDGDPRVFVRGVLDADVADDRLGAPERTAAVSVLTPAASAGREYDTVIVAGVQEGVWPNTRLRGSLLDTWRLGDADSRAPGDQGAPAVLDRRRAALHDELRLLARALSRARSRLIVTAVDDDDDGPSVFFELLPTPEAADAEMAHPMSLRGLVARHRRALTDPAAPAPARAAAPGQLAVLARAGVPGAAPQEWYGLRPPTTDAALRDLAHADIRLSPSRLAAIETCPLDWVIADLGGDSGGAVSAGVGTILHAALELAADASEAALWQIVEQRWGELTFESAWQERAEKARARDLVRRLHLYLQRFAADGGVLVGAEPHFEVSVPAGEPGAPHGLVVSGFIDRVEVDAAGRAVIVDLKTGGKEPQSDRAVAENPQLAAYQLAHSSGAIPQVADLPSGGAKLLVLRPTAAGKDYAQPWQPPLDDTQTAAFLTRLQSAARIMRGRTFDAPYEEHCRDDYSYGLCRIHTVKPVSAS